MNLEATILSTAYLPPIQLFAPLVFNDKTLLEQHENYTKQTYRNRCTILGANGTLDLIVPIVKNSGIKIPIKDVLIDYATPWQKIHWKAIESAYKSSPYFEHIEDSLRPFYYEQTKYLFDLNQKLIDTLLDFLEIRPNIESTKEFTHDYPEGYIDLRGISPKHENKAYSFNCVPYYQVFSHKQPFVPDLSIIDLICNEGLFSVDIMRKTI
jgi:WbqC-like protein family.